MARSSTPSTLQQATRSQHSDERRERFNRVEAQACPCNTCELKATCQMECHSYKDYVLTGTGKPPQRSPDTAAYKAAGKKRWADPEYRAMMVAARRRRGKGKSNG